MEEEATQARTAGRAVGEALLRYRGRMETKWGHVETNAQGEERAAAVRYHAALIEATVAHMGGAEAVGQSAGEVNGGAAAAAGAMAEMMAEAGCMVPSLMATTRDRQLAGLKQLVEWAKLPRKRGYPIDVLGCGAGRSAKGIKTWREKVLSITVQGPRAQTEQKSLHFGTTVRELEEWVEQTWGLPAGEWALHGGRVGSDTANTQLMQEMQLGRLWGAVAGKARVQVRPRTKPAKGAMELVLGYAGAAKHVRWTYLPSDGGGEELGRQLQTSPDDTLIQVPTAWVDWLREHMEVKWEWCTSWYGMARVQGVTSRVVGNIPHQLVSGSVQRAW
jgi:hypothetical protein